ncbi:MULTISPECIES: hypothetical protein [Candidatus Nitrosocaldus]|jgi:uncharacterized membrane protein|uniref:Protocatechuate 3,4-dioxygenase beta subunit n=1 Tax=Candidatus Nitrosocaldus cavascurensis TaxID=2058097 RepID=A0A2K5APJ7_9ARCH
MRGILYAAAACTAIGGILHLIMAPRLLEFNVAGGAFFIIAGILQLFWVLPTIKQYSNIFNYVGIGGTIGLIALWAITRVPNPITNRGGPINEMGIAVQVFQVAFVALLAVIIAKGRRTERKVV